LIRISRRSLAGFAAALPFVFAQRLVANTFFLEAHAGMKRRTLLAAPLALAAQESAPVYVLLWFDTEDYVDPAADDAALRLATDLDRLGVRATFKMVGEKARVLEQRGRRDVIRALARHDIGYHTDFHSVQPVPAMYLEQMGWLDGAAEFRRREEPGLKDVQRIFGVMSSCYGQPGSSWGPQAHRALRQMGIPVYLDEGSHVVVRDQPYWFAGLLNVFGIRSFAIRAGLRAEDKFDDFAQRFDQQAATLRQRGGGVISIYYHPCEFSATEFWDGVNFSRGEARPREQWKIPAQRTPADRERTFQVMIQLAKFLKSRPVGIITASDVPRLFESAWGRPLPRAEAKQHLRMKLAFHESPTRVLSAAELLLTLLDVKVPVIEGPAERAVTTVRQAVPRWLFEQAIQEAAAEVRASHRLPSRVWLGAESLSLADFAATLAADDGAAAHVAVRTGDLTELESYVNKDPRRVYNWAIHPETFEGRHLLDLARLQSWTLKPARLR